MSKFHIRSSSVLTYIGACVLLAVPIFAQESPPVGEPIIEGYTALGVFTQGFSMQIGFELAGFVIRLVRSASASGRVDNPAGG